MFDKYILFKKICAVLFETFSKVCVFHCIVLLCLWVQDGQWPECDIACIAFSAFAILSQENIATIKSQRNI